MSGLTTIPGAISSVGLRLPENMTFDDWCDVGRTLRNWDRALPWCIGDWLNFGERKYGEKYSQVLDATDYEYQTLANTKYVANRFEFSRRRENLSFAHHSEVAALAPAEQDAWLDKAESESWARAELRKQIKAPSLIEQPAPPTGLYSCIVIDPPWEMQKIDRDVRPKQKAFDYPPMSEDELAALTLPAADNCHLYLWTTHKHLPVALNLAGLWGFKYECMMTWVKNVGFTPYSWMRSTEHVLFCRKGNLSLLELGRRLDFPGKVREHSRKPDEFYKLVCEVSPGPRIDMFARGPHEGFDLWGAEPDKFTEAS